MSQADKGFTLLEVLVALVIVTASSAIVLAHISSLMDINSRVRSQQQEVTELFNKTAEFPFVDYSQVRLSIKPPAIELHSNDGTHIASIENFSDRPKNLPPIDKLYTHYQTYSIKKTRRQIDLLLKGMPYGDTSKQ